MSVILRHDFSLECSLAGNQWEQLEGELWLCLSRRKREAPPEENRSGEKSLGLPSLGRKWWGAGMEIHNDRGWGLAEACWAKLCHPAAWSPGPQVHPKAHVCLKGTGKQAPVFHVSDINTPTAQPIQADTMSSSCAPAQTPIHRDLNSNRCLSIHTPSISLIQLLYTLPDLSINQFSRQQGTMKEPWVGEAEPLLFSALLPISEVTFPSNLHLHQTPVICPGVALSTG